MQPIDAAQRKLGCSLGRLAGLCHVGGDRCQLLRADLRVGVHPPAQPRGMPGDPLPRVGLQAGDIHELALGVRDERRVRASGALQGALEDVDRLLYSAQIHEQRAEQHRRPELRGGIRNGLDAPSQMLYGRLGVECEHLGGAQGDEQFRAL